MKIIVVVKEVALPYVFFDILKPLLYEALFFFLRENNIRGQHEFLMFITGEQKQNLKFWFKCLNLRKAMIF